jgi:hypothetical protein
MNLEDFLGDYLGIKEFKKYSVSSYKDNEELKIIIEKFLKKHKDKIGLKACYYNASLMMRADPRIGYCEGYAGIKLSEQILPIEHAWNVFDEDFYFDMTSEHLFDGDLGKGHNSYIELYRTYDKAEAKKVVEGFIRPYMRRKK